MRRLTGVLLLGALLAPSAAARAQSTRLSVSGFPLNFPTPTAADFATGSIQASSPISFEVNATSGWILQPRLATVSIRCNLPCPATGRKPPATLEWRRADTGTWMALTTTDAVVDAQWMFLWWWNDPWGNDIYWRALLDWQTDQSATTSTFGIVMTLTITVP